MDKNGLSCFVLSLGAVCKGSGGRMGGGCHEGGGTYRGGVGEGLPLSQSSDGIGVCGGGRETYVGV